MKNLEKKYILNEAESMDWNMHKSTKPVHLVGKVDAEDELVEDLPKDTEYIVINNRKDDKEKEFSVIAKIDKKYYFITNAKTFISEVK